MQLFDDDGYEKMSVNSLADLPRRLGFPTNTITMRECDKNIFGFSTSIVLHLAIKFNPYRRHKNKT